jgi:hypothetical protein
MQQSLKAILFIALLSTTLFACRKQDDDIAATSNQVLTSGTWKVSSFTELSDNKTSDFLGYDFDFNSDGKLIVSKSGTVMEGSWSISSNRLNIDLGSRSASGKLGELTDDWLIFSKTSLEMTLKDDNSERQELLIFSRN